MSDRSSSSWKIVENMMEKDAFSQWLGIQVLAVKEGFAKLSMEVKPDMLNGFGIAHGGITYSLADSALAFASNAHGRKAVSTGTSIAHYQRVKEGDVLVAEAKESNLGEKVAHYQITIRNQNEEVVASFFGSVYRSSKEWDI